MLNFTLNTDTVSLVSIFKNIGIGGWCIIIILLMLSVISIYIFVDRSIAIKKASRRKNSFINHIKDFIYEEKIDSAVDLCHSTNTPIARMIEKGLSRVEDSLDDVSNTIENVGKLEIYKLENNLSALASISGAAPMLGFLGTAMGMVIAFHQVDIYGLNPESLASGIYTAMITTVLGLVVGILAYLAYNHLTARVQRVIHFMESDILSFLDLLHDKRNKKLNNDNIVESDMPPDDGENFEDNIFNEGFSEESQSLDEEGPVSTEFN